ncbi:MAG TPA: Arc family DNA-binding protein [Noviherbaspirillum sp.]|nr:Arc family DNA-binding protein [Noviherbaspirillum sp.]
MAKQKQPLPYITKFNLRIQSDLKETLNFLARKAPRSLNAEMIARLERSLIEKKELCDYSDGELIDELIKRWGREAILIRLGKEQ